MDENWFILLIAIVKKTSAEESYNLFYFGRKTPIYPQVKPLVTMLQLRHSNSLGQLARMFKVNRRSMVRKMKKCRDETVKEYIELAVKLHEKGFTILECVDLIEDMVKTENIELKKAV